MPSPTLPMEKGKEMDSALNRAARRKMRSRAHDLADRYLASGILVVGLCGGVRRLENPEARRIVRAELVKVLRNGGIPRLRRLSLDQDRLFPFMSSAHPDADPWLAVGIDLDGRATIVTRWLPQLARSNCKVGQACRLQLLGELTTELHRPGIDIPTPMGSA